jgi:hypothetical protein
MLKETMAAGFTAAAIAVALGGCAVADQAAIMSTDRGWTTLVDGTRGLENFERVGDANWVAQDGAIQASSGGKDPGYLVTRTAYRDFVRDFVLKAEFWASDDANSGIFLRCQEPNRITDENCYEANIFDQRPDPSYGTGAIVKIAKAPDPMPKAGGRWNTYEVVVQGDHLLVMLNGVKTVDVHDAKLASGPIALQWGRGIIKFRKVQVKPLE